MSLRIKIADTCPIRPYGYVGCSEVAYRRNIYKFEWSCRSR